MSQTLRQLEPGGSLVRSWRRFERRLTVDADRTDIL
jgi:hypothetical protein